MIRSLQRIKYFMSQEPIRWRLKNEMLEFLVYDFQSEGRIIYLVDNEITFAGLK